MFKFKKQLNIFIILFLTLNFSCVGAAMQSNSYVIYENVLHDFSGPVISGVAHSVTENVVTVTWNTDVLANSYVVYDTDNTFLNSREQGFGLKNKTSHSVSLSGLLENTVYYYKVKSERVNGGVTIDSSVYTVTTGAVNSASEEEAGASSGGLLIIDKTDKESPIIDKINVKVNLDNVEISWDTNEDATGFVKYGADIDYGNIAGDWKYNKNHKIVLKNLEASRQYHFQVLSSDNWANLASSSDAVFITLNEKGQEEEPIDWDDQEATTTATSTEEKKQDIDPQVLFENLRKFISRILPQVSLNEVSDNQLADINSLEDLINFTPTPMLMGQPRVEVGATEVRIFWDSDVETNSLVAFSPANKFNSSLADPYLQVVGRPDDYSFSHEVAIYNLSPETVYHYQIRGKEKFGLTAKSRDFTFKTNSEDLIISSFFSQVEDDYTANFKWVTNKDADTQVRISPYKGNILAIDEAKIFRDNKQSVIHEMKITEFKPGVNYRVELFSMNEKGNLVTEVLDNFSTSEDDLPPVISGIKAESTIYIDKSNKIQTVISWKTNEPTTAKIYFQEGVHGADVELSESTEINNDYSKEHVFVLNKFKPGTVYSFRVESIDSGGNTTLSRGNTFMTAKKKESIIQIIIKILEDTFGWVKDIG